MKFKQSLVRHAYSWLWRLFAPFYLIKLWRRGRKEPEYWQHVGQRFGFYGHTPAPAHAGEYIWVHAVSLGEARACAVLIDALRQQIPHMKLLLTHGTATGWKQGKSIVQEGDVQCWLPIDMPGGVKRFIRRFQPRIGLLMETEMWPNLMHVTHTMKVPVMLVNARLSARSLKGALKVGALLCPAYQALAAALAQSDEDAQRLQTLGTPVVEVLGNIKYDMLPDLALAAQGKRWKETLKRTIIMAASTRDGEEELLLQAWLQASWRLKPQAEQPILLLVPRHPQRFDEVAQLIRASGLSGSLRSTWGKQGPSAQDMQVDVWLGDSLQEMAMYYGLSDMVILGGSFKPFGGQNLIEALACGNPIIMGEHTYNFTLACQLALNAGVAYRAADFGAALQQASLWLQTPDGLNELQEKSKALIDAHQGASERMAAYIVQALPRIM